MSLITPPATLPIRRIQWSLRQPHQVNRSGWTARRQVLTTPGGAFWSCSAELKPIRLQSVAKQWIAFFQSLEGQLHKFPVVAVEQAQHGGANPTVVSGAAGARSAILSANVAELGAGDKLTFKLIDGTYQLVTMTGAMSGTGVSFVPALRNAAATGAGSVETVQPFAHVSLTADSFEYSVDPGQIYSFSFDAEEIVLMSLPDTTAGAQLNSGSFAIAWLAWLDIVSDPVRATTAPRSLTFGSVGDTDLDGQTFDAVDPTVVSVTDVKNAEGGTDTISFTLSGIVGPDSDLLNLLGDTTKWRGRTARLWAIIYDEAGAQQGAIWPIYTGRMSAMQIVGDPSQQTVKLDVESYLASLKQASNRTYLDQASFDPLDNTAALKIGVANGNTKGMSQGGISQADSRSWNQFNRYEQPF